MKFRTIRAIRQIGGAMYLAIPKLARRELRLLVGDFVHVELDDELHTITLSPVNLRAQMPMIGFKQQGWKMTPVDEPNVEPRENGGKMTPVLEEVR